MCMTLHAGPQDGFNRACFKESFYAFRMFEMLNDFFFNLQIEYVEQPGRSFWEWLANHSPTFIATAVALFLGLYGPVVARRLNPPRLLLRLAEKAGSMTNTGAFDGPLRTYFHLVVENQKRRESIHDVQVCLLDVIVTLDDGEPVHGYSGPIPLSWRHKLGGGDGAVPRTIGAPCEADLLSFNSTELALSLPAAPFRLPTCLINRRGVFAGAARAKFENTMVLRVFAQARGSEADSDIIELEVTWDMNGPNDPLFGVPYPEISGPVYHKRMPADVLASRIENAPQPDLDSRILHWGGTRVRYRV